MFSTIIAYCIFIIASIFWISIFYDVFRTKSETERLIDKLEAARRGYRKEYSFWRILVLLLIWIASGIYLWG